MKLKLMATSVFLLAQVSLAGAADPVPADAAKTIFTLYDDGGEHFAQACGKARAMPEKFKRLKRLYDQKDYMGSKQTQFADQNAAGIDAWDHFFSSAKACEKARLQLEKDAAAGG
ncbi:hypothetical protein [Janthinobacterium sp. RB2R34]|uniref:hypothetical protein n=1 Tax=Janthinobacterium sp. RB2R34 TaxID=3424193 RepID=UPI003F28FD0B